MFPSMFLDSAVQAAYLNFNFLAFVSTQLGLERELIKYQSNLEAEINLRAQANSSKTEIESK